jgi:hypothetical protein
MAMWGLFFLGPGPHSRAPWSRLHRGRSQHGCAPPSYPFRSPSRIWASFSRTVYKRPGNVLRALCFTLVAFLVAAPPLTVAFGPFGCAFATLASSIVLLLAITIPFRDKLLPVIGEGCRSIGPAVALAPLLLLRGGIDDEHRPAVCARIGLYVLILFVARIARLEEIRIFREALARPTSEPSPALADRSRWPIACDSLRSNSIGSRSGASSGHSNSRRMHGRPSISHAAHLWTSAVATGR